MNKLGKVAFVSADHRVKVVFDDLKIMTQTLYVCKHVDSSNLMIGDEVVVAMYDDSIRHGAVVGVIGK